MAKWVTLKNELEEEEVYVNVIEDIMEDMGGWVSGKEDEESENGEKSEHEHYE